MTTIKKMPSLYNWENMITIKQKNNYNTCQKLLHGSTVGCFPCTRGANHNLAKHFPSLRLQVQMNDCNTEFYLQYSSPG